MPNKKLFGPMVCHMSLSKALVVIIIISRSVNMYSIREHIYYRLKKMLYRTFIISLELLHFYRNIFFRCMNILFCYKSLVLKYFCKSKGHYFLIKFPLQSVECLNYLYTNSIILDFRLSNVPTDY